MNGLEDWKERSMELYKAISELNKAFDAERKMMEDEIKQIFGKHGLIADSVTGSSDNSEFLVRFVGDTSKQIQFPKKLLDDIGMGFVVRRVLNEEANNELLIEIYPFDDGEL